ncbi:MerR family transcriptional regulator [Kribbella sp. NPDC020789]
MRIGELSKATGVPVPTIKYYLREGLLPPGELTSPNQASYGEAHIRRLRLIRALVDLAQVPVAQVKEIVASLDADDVPLHDQIGRAHRALTPTRKPTASPEAREAAAREVDALITRRGWTVEPDAPALATLTETVAALHSLGQHNLVSFLDAYAEAVERFTHLEVQAVSAPTRDQLAESVVIGTILGETLISSLRLLAQESISATLWR